MQLNDTGSEGGRSRLLAQVRARAVGFARRVAGPAEAEDLAQEALLVLETRYPHLDRAEDLVPVALRIVRYKAAALWRKRRRRGEDRAEEWVEDRVASGSPGPDDLAERRELLDLLTAAVVQLGDRCRELFRLKLAGHDFAEIRAAMGAATLNTVYTWDHRCRQELRDRLGLTVAARKGERR